MLLSAVCGFFSFFVSVLSGFFLCSSLFVCLCFFVLFFKLDALEKISVKDMQMFLFQSYSSTSGKLQSVKLVDKGQFILVYCIFFLICSVEITQEKSRTRDQMLWYFFSVLEVIQFKHSELWKGLMFIFFCISQYCTDIKT